MAGTAWEVRRLRLLQELAARGTVAAVAEALHLTPSAVSQGLAQLEREVGVELLRRVGRRLVLTAQAEILVAHTEAVLRQLETAQSQIAASLSQATGTVRLAVFQSAALALLPEALTVLARDHPQVRVRVTQREPETALRETWARDFDLVVAEQYPGHAAPRPDGLDREPLTSDRLALVVPAVDRWAGARSLTDVADAAWVAEPDGAASRHWAEQRCREAGFEPDVRYQTADLQAHLALVRSGHAVAVVPGLMLRSADPAAGPGVRTVPLAGDPRRTLFTATRTTMATHPGVVAVRAALGLAAAVVSDGASRVAP